MQKCKTPGEGTHFYLHQLSRFFPTMKLENITGVMTYQMGSLNLLQIWREATSRENRLVQGVTVPEITKKNRNFTLGVFLLISSFSAFALARCSWAKSSILLAVLAYGLSLRRAPRFFNGFFFSARLLISTFLGRTTLWISSELMILARSGLDMMGRGST